MTVQNSDDVTRDRIAHFYELSHLGYKGSIDFAVIALRAVMLVNGGAILSLLTFAGNVQPETDALYNAFACFIGGLMTALFSIATAFYAQQLMSRALYSDGHLLYWEALDQSDLAKENSALGARLRKGAQKYRIASMAFATASVTLFGAGCFAALDAVSGLA